jgi:rsbT co-antagonist protein RsbR
MHTFSSPFLAAILEQLPFFVALKDAESRRYVLVNASFCALMGRPSDELQGKRDEEIIGDLRATEQRGLEDRVIATGQPMIVPEISFGATRDERTLSVSLVPLSEGGNGVSHLLVSGQDITRQKLAARALAAQTEELDRKLEVIHAQHEQIRSLSVPLLDVGGGVLGVPLIGTMDEQRAIDLTHRLLRAITERRVRDVILDLTGIEAVDTGAIDHLLRIVRAVRLLGARTLITGISPALAQAMTALDVDLSGVVTMRTLRDALLACADLTGPLQGEGAGG